MKVGLDTNIFLNVKNKEEPFYQHSEVILEAIDGGEFEAIVSIITIAELCVGYYETNEIRDKDEFIAGLYSNQYYKIIDLNLKVADKSGEIKNKSNLKLPDSIITASSVLEEASCLITNDVSFKKAKDFINIYTSEDFCEKYIQKDE